MPSERKDRRKKLLVICPHPVGYAPGQRLKYEQYFDIFKENGYDITISPFMSEPFQRVVYKKGKYFQKILWTMAGYAKRLFDVLRAGKYDVVYVFLWVAPFAPPLFEKIIRRSAKKVIYDIDDLVFLNPSSSANPLIHYLRSSRNHISLMRTADHVITCTPYLDQFVRKYNENTTDISSTINTTAYRPKSDYRIREKLIIGWSGSHSTSRYLHLLDDVFLSLSRKIDFKLVVMGDPDFTLPGINVEAIPWSEKHEIETIRSFDIGVYPLPNEQWVYGKSGLKALQYMALGVPTVASALGTIFRIIENDRNGFLVSTPQEWEQRIEELMRNDALRERIGKAAVTTVNTHYSIDANKGKYLAILDKLSSS